MTWILSCAPSPRRVVALMPRDDRSRPGDDSRATPMLLSRSGSSVDAMVGEFAALDRRVRRKNRDRLRRDLRRAAERFDQLDPEAAALARWFAREVA